jgi:hypothetical protein
MTRSGVSCPGFDMGRSIDRISLAALLLIDEEQEPILEAVNVWLKRRRLRSVSELQYREWTRLHEDNAAPVRAAPGDVSAGQRRRGPVARHR